MKTRPAARVARDGRGARVELEAAALGRDRDAQRVAREQQLRRAAVDRRRLASGPAALAVAVDLDDALARGEVARGRDLLDERLDVGAEELGRLVAGLADQMEVPRVPVRVLEAEAALAEIDLAGDARIDHPLERAVDRGAADPLVFAADDVEEIVGAEVPLLLEEHVQDEVALARPLGARRPEPIDVGNRWCSCG